MAEDVEPGQSRSAILRLMEPIADRATLARIFHAPLPETLDDPIVGPVLRRLAAEDPDVFDAIADVDRSLIWASLVESPEVRVGRAVGIARMGEEACRVNG